MIKFKNAGSNVHCCNLRHSGNMILAADRVSVPCVIMQYTVTKWGRLECRPLLHGDDYLITQGDVDKMTAIRRHFQLHFVERKRLYIFSNFTKLFENYLNMFSADGRLIAKSREASKPRDSGLDFSNRSEIWQASRRC